MEWVVIKMGLEMFDALHAYGLGIVLAHTSGLPVELTDDGCRYMLQDASARPLCAPLDALDAIFNLPSSEEMKSEGRMGPTTAAVANLDGLLAGVWTIPHYVRCCSVADLLQKQRFDPASVAKGIAKVREVCAKWKKLTRRETKSVGSWLTELLENYDPASPCIPLPAQVARAADITTTMTLDPSLSYASRRPLSDGQIGKKTNVTIRGTRFAPLLAYIGAARFLRSQHVLGDLVNFYVPLATQLSLHADLTLARLPTVEDTADHALVAQALFYTAENPVVGAKWKGLAYQTLQTQGTQQPLSLFRGFLDLRWFDSLKKRAGMDLIRYWRLALYAHRDALPYEIDPIVEALASRRLDAWIAHLTDVARAVHSVRRGTVRLYTLKEVKEVTMMMEPSQSLPLSTILERKKGTLRFGHALRLLNEYNPSAVRDLIEELETVHTRDQLLHVLGHIVQVCAVTAAKERIIIIPTDKDAQYLLDDVDQHGAHTIAGLLILLSALRYPSSEEADQYTPQTLWRVIRTLLASLAAQAAETGTSCISDPTIAEIPPAIHLTSSERKGDL